MEKKKKRYVPIFYDWVEVTEELTAEEKGRLIDAVVLYAQGKAGDVRLTGNEKYLYPAFRKQIDRENEKSANKSKAATKREREKAQKAQGTTKSTKDRKNANKNKNNNKNENKNNNNNKNDNEETVSTDTGKNDEGFARFWSLYPRKQDKVKARKAFDDIGPDEQLLTVMLDAIERQKRSHQWTKDGGQYIPLAATWLHGQRWEDEGIEECPRERESGSFPRQDYTFLEAFVNAV